MTLEARAVNMTAEHQCHSGARGDLFCTVVVETPVKLSADQREMLRTFAESLKKEGGKHTPRGESFCEGVKRFFSSEPT